MTRNFKRRLQRGSAFIASFVLLSMVAVAGVTYVDSATQTIGDAKRRANDAATTQLCEAGVQAVMRSLWRPFKVDQDFDAMELACAGADEESPAASISGDLPGVGRYAAGVIAFWEPNGDTYTRIATIRSVGWIDTNNNSELDANEPSKVVDVTASFILQRSAVFDYSYFVNNYGWMNGFSPSQLIVNGDLRANGNFEFLSGSPTINGSVYAAYNEKIMPTAAGRINQAPVKWNNGTYQTQAALNPSNAADNQHRWRQQYNAGIHGAIGTAQFDQWRDLVFESNASIVNNRSFGAVVADATGVRAWERLDTSTSGTTNLLDTNPSEEVIMPDLSDISNYQALSATFVNTRSHFADGTADPNFGRGAFIEVWNPALNSGLGAYETVTTNGTVSGSVTLVGTASRPIRIHGPVTVSQDIVIKGHVSGQGTLYAGRNVHVVGSIRYTNRPSFRGTVLADIDRVNQKADMLALAARGSIMMGDIGPSDFAINYMIPPFTKPRRDENGNTIPAFDARVIDSGQPRHRTIVPGLPPSFYEGINQIDAVLYTNFVGGGELGMGGGGVIFNGSIISKDEAMIVYSLPLQMNYDSRIRERSLTSIPLIDISLPRSPALLRSSWQDRGFCNGL